jgi:diaminopimelate epimerase
MTRLSFVKMQALGNDFVVLDHRRPGGETDASAEELRITPVLARSLCDRRLGIGGDQILDLRTPHDLRAQARMEVWNADGSTSEMCGNGLRAVAAFLAQRAQPAQRSFQIESAVGLHPVRVIDAKGGHPPQFAIEMGPPRAVAPQAETLEVQGRSFEFLRVSMGNPHAIFWVKPHEIPSLEAFPLEHWGPLLENHPLFAPERTNVEFVEALGPQHVRVRVWERGAGLTLACGSGACASAVAALVLQKVAGPELQVDLPGGALRVRWSGRPEDSLEMEGPASEVFAGEILV